MICLHDATPSFGNRTAKEETGVLYTVLPWTTSQRPSLPQGTSTTRLSFVLTSRGVRILVSKFQIDFETCSKNIQHTGIQFKPRIFQKMVQEVHDLAHKFGRSFSKIDITQTRALTLCLLNTGTKPRLDSPPKPDFLPSPMESSLEFFQSNISIQHLSQLHVHRKGRQRKAKESNRLRRYQGFLFVLAWVISTSRKSTKPCTERASLCVSFVGIQQLLYPTD